MTYRSRNIGEPFRSRNSARRAERTIQAALDAGSTHAPLRGQWIELPPWARGVRVEGLKVPGKIARQHQLVLTMSEGH